MNGSLIVIRSISEFLVVFSVGSGAGWWLEFTYRGIVRKGDFVNPGFLSGPYLPIYGFGAFFLYIIDWLPCAFPWKILAFGMAASLMELATGLFFVRFFNLRLWDYSDRRGNVKGQICPLFTFYWSMAGIAGLWGLVPVLKDIVLFFNANIHYTFFLGLYYGVILSDVINSFNVASRLGSLARNMKLKGLPPVLDYRMLRRHLRDVQSRISRRTLLGRFLMPFNNISRRDLEEHLSHFVERIQGKRKKKAAIPKGALP